MKKPCKNPCPECPYAKKSIPGYFGGLDPREYAQAIGQDTVIACHTRSKYDTNGHVKMDDVVVCTGHIVAQIKSCKQTIHPVGKLAHEQIRAQSNFEQLKTEMLGLDFWSHHKIEF